MTPVLQRFMLATDLGMLTYWSLTALVAFGWLAVPPEWLFSNYADPMIVAWNWSFMPLDVALSTVGLRSVWLAHQDDERWRHWATVSLALTSCAGLMAISFWAIRLEFDAAWWGANLFLAIWPLPFLLRGFNQRAGNAALSRSG